MEKRPNIEERLVNMPFNPEKSPLYYGWFILALGAVGILMSIPGQTMGVSVFTDYLIDALGISRLNLSLTYMIGTTLSSLVLSRAGKFYDRFGVRLTVLLSGSIMGLILLFLSQVDRIAGAAAQVTPLSPYVWGFTLMILGFFLLRFSGQGVMTMISRSMVMKWFNKRRGLAAAILGVVTSFGFSYAPRLLDSLIQNHTWREAWQVLALVCGFAMALFGFIFFRDNPRICRLKQDGRKEVKENPKTALLHRTEELTLKEAKRRPALWIFAVSLAILSLYNTAYTFHVVSIFGKIGLDRSQAIGIFLPISLVSVSSQFLISALSDRVRLEILYLIYLAGLVLGMVAILFLGTGLPILLLIIGMGISGGVFGTLTSITWVRLYGNAHLGAISGFGMSWMVVGSAVGPYLFSLAEQFTGSYNPAVLLCLVLTAAMIVCTSVLWLKRRDEPLTSSSDT